MNRLPTHRRQVLGFAEPSMIRTKIGHHGLAYGIWELFQLRLDVMKNLSSVGILAVAMFLAISSLGFGAAPASDSGKNLKAVVDQKVVELNALKAENQKIQEWNQRHQGRLDKLNNILRALVVAYEGKAPNKIKIAREKAKMLCEGDACLKKMHEGKELRTLVDFELLLRNMMATEPDFIKDYISVLLKMVEQLKKDAKVTAKDDPVVALRKLVTDPSVMERPTLENRGTLKAPVWQITSKPKKPTDSLEALKKVAEEVLAAHDGLADDAQFQACLTELGNKLQAVNTELTTDIPALTKAAQDKHTADVGIATQEKTTSEQASGKKRSDATSAANAASKDEIVKRVRAELDKALSFKFWSKPNGKSVPLEPTKQIVINNENFTAESLTNKIKSLIVSNMLTDFNQYVQKVHPAVIEQARTIGDVNKGPAQPEKLFESFPALKEVLEGLKKLGLNILISKLSADDIVAFDKKIAGIQSEEGKKLQGIIAKIDGVFSTETMAAAKKFETRKAELDGALKVKQGEIAKKETAAKTRKDKLTAQQTITNTCKSKRQALDGQARTLPTNATAEQLQKMKTDYTAIGHEAGQITEAPIRRPVAK